MEGAVREMVPGGEPGLRVGCRAWTERFRVDGNSVPQEGVPESMGRGMGRKGEQRKFGSGSNIGRWRGLQVGWWPRREGRERFEGLTYTQGG